MPVLIKSSSGQRSIKLLSSNAEKKSDLRSELIELLKGLTIKLEIKVDDVVMCGAETPFNMDELTGVTVKAEPPNQIGRETLARHIMEPPPLLIKRQGNPLEPKEMRHTNGVSLETSSSSVQARPKIGVSFGSLGSPKTERELADALADVKLQEQPRQAPVVVQQVQQEAPRPAAAPTQVAAAPTPTSRERAQQVKPQLLPVNRAPEAVKPGKPFLVRGEIKIGSAVSTICVNVVSREEPIIIYVAYNQKKLVEIIHKIKDIEDDIEAQPLVKTVDVGDIVFGKSNDDDCWYRCMVTSVCGDEIELYFFDWGYTENVDITRIRRLTELGLGLAKNPACAVKVKFTEESRPYIDEVLDCERRFSIRVENYEEVDGGIYTTTILGLLDD